MKKIAIYGGSFNPIHNGHIALAQYAQNELELDRLIFVPAYRSPFKKQAAYADANHRLEMIKLALPSKMDVSDFEIKRQGISYTIETVRYFKQQFPDAQLYLLIGTDQLYKLHKWRAIAEIVDQVQIVALRRTNDFPRYNIAKYKIKLLDNELLPQAGTAFRAGDFTTIDSRVARYIGQHHLYIDDLLRGMIDVKNHQQRYQHCRATGRAAAHYAKQVGINPQQAWLAGTFHDITKTWSEAKHRQFIRDQGLDDQHYQFHQLHSLTGSLWLKNVYFLPDLEVIQAVRRHTSLARDLTMLDQVVYVADKIAHGRTHAGVQSERKLVAQNFQAGFQVVVRHAYRAILQKGVVMDAAQKDIFESYIKSRVN